MRRSAIACTFSLVVVLLALAAAQPRSYTLTGQVRTATGRALPTVTVTLRENGEPLATSRNPISFSFKLSLVSGARYDLLIEAQSYQRWLLPLALDSLTDGRLNALSPDGLRLSVGINDEFFLSGRGIERGRSPTAGAGERGGPPTPMPKPMPPPPPPPPSLPTSGSDQTHTIVSVFYATDRNRLTLQPPAYGTMREGTEQLHLGRFDVSVPRAAHEKGQIERPSIWSLYRDDPDKHIYIMRGFEQEYEDFYEQLSKLVGDSTRKQVFVFVHGYNVTFEEAIFRTAQVAYDLQFDGPPVLYSWPSLGSSIQYLADANNADWSVPHLRWFLEDVAQKAQAQAVHVIAHSMGNRVTVPALNRVVVESGTNVRSKFNQVVLAAPDIDASIFKQLASTLRSAGERITLYASSNDLALQASKRVQGYQRAGDALPNVLIVDGIETVDVSATDTNLIGLGHSYYGDRTTILSDLFYLIRERLGAERRAGLDPVGQPPSRYWVFRR